MFAHGWCFLSVTGALECPAMKGTYLTIVSATTTTRQDMGEQTDQRRLSQQELRHLHGAGGLYETEERAVAPIVIVRLPNAERVSCGEAASSVT